MVIERLVGDFTVRVRIVVNADVLPLLQLLFEPGDELLVDTGDISFQLFWLGRLVLPVPLVSPVVLAIRLAFGLAIGME